MGSMDRDKTKIIFINGYYWTKWFAYPNGIQCFSREVKGDALNSTCKCNTFMENVFMNNYYHLSPEERALIMIEHSQGSSFRSIHNKQW